MEGIDPEKIKFIEAMIKGSFQCGPIISTANDIDQKFVVNDGTDSYHLIIARAFLDANNVPYVTEPSTKALDAADVAARTQKFTVLIECWQ